MHGEHMDGLVVYEELKLDDLPLFADFAQVLLMSFDAQVIHTTGMFSMLSNAMHGKGHGTQ